MIFKTIRLLLLAVIGYVLYRMLWKGEGWNFFKFKKKKKSSTPSQPVEEMKKDPVCGTYVPEHEAIKYRKGGQIHYFCCEQCKDQFLSLNK